MQWRGARVLVTGASGGLGESFARALAANGSDLVLAARSGDKLSALAHRLHSEYGVDVVVLVADLSAPGAGVKLYAEATADGAVDVVVNNAGFALHGNVVDNDADELTQEVALNVATLVDLTRAALPEMVARHRGAIINIASIAAFQPLRGMAVYAATKSFVLSFTQALAAECRGTGVDILAVCPGPVDTGFFDRAGISDRTFGKPATAEDVVAAALASLGRRPVVIPGVRNRTLALGSRLLPRGLVVRAAGGIVRRGRPQGF
jgi:short-subunit dehydrogenase